MNAVRTQLRRLPECVLVLALASVACYTVVSLAFYITTMALGITPMG